MYKQARLFEDEENLAFLYADLHFRKILGDAVYDY